jgi:hypothetical protein
MVSKSKHLLGEKPLKMAFGRTVKPWLVDMDFSEVEMG